MIYQNTLNLLQVRGGNYIKQTDRASLVGYMLQDHKHKKICDLDGETAYVTLVDRINERYFKTISTVDESVVMFKLDGNLENGIYDVEIEIDGHVFPSDNKVWLNLSTSHSATKIVGNDGFDLSKVLTPAKADSLYAKKEHSHVLADIIDADTISDNDILDLFN